VILSDAHDHTFYEYTPDGELCLSITIESISFNIDGHRDRFAVFQLTTTNYVVAQTIVRPGSSGWWCAELELKKIGPDRKSKSGNWKVQPCS